MRGSVLYVYFQPLKYQFFDDGEGGLINNDNVTLSLWYTAVPNAGILAMWPAIGSHTIAFGGMASKYLFFFAQ